MSMKVGAAATTTTITSTSPRDLHDTPTWALAVVSLVFIAISIVIEHYIHVLGRWLKRHHKKALSNALEKLKAELMLLGFISLLLAVTQRPITKICIPPKAADTMLPCRKSLLIAKTKAATSNTNGSSTAAAVPDYCSSKGMVALISQEGLGQLHIFIFVLALMHVIYSVLTMVLGKAKMRRWKAWEKETQTLEYEVSNDPNRFRYIRDTTFGRRHMNSWIEASYFLWIKCFFRQFFNSVPKTDYLTLRHGFISTHMSTSSTFNFQKYIERSLEDDFKIVIGISPALWFIVVIFLLFNVHGFQFYLWIALIPVVIVLALGAKLEVIVARMAIKLKNQNTVIRGSPLVEPNDDLFWFGHPKFVLHFIHLTLFMNAYELAYFVWITYEFGFNSCYHDNTTIIIIRIVLAVTVQVICSYVTLPLYALVTQMGSQFKRAVLEEQTARVLKDWHTNVRAKRKMQPQEESNFPSNNSRLKVNSNKTIIETHVSSPADHPSSSTSTFDEIVPVGAKRKMQPQEESNFPSNNSRLKVNSNKTIIETHVSSPADHPSSSTSTFDEIVPVDPHEKRNQT